jgi:hypothetical protein
MAAVAAAGESKSMNNASEGTRARRARIYFRLMDITLVLALIGFTEFLLDEVFGIILTPKSSPFYLPISIFFIFMNFIVPWFLILARFMRDEYAELLWRRTAAVAAYTLALAPVFVLLCFWAAYLLTGKKVSEGVFAPLVAPTEAFQVVWFCWLAFMLMFVAIFQLLRWRDAR